MAEPRTASKTVQDPARRTQTGKIFLVGAGPGDPGLLTLRGKECIEKADVVVFDRLASDKLLEFARPGAEMIYVGKQSSNHTVPQDEINEILVRKALEGKTVTRLKGGDPYIFGRGGEEAEYARRNGIEFEVVPGVTSAIAGPAYAGIPLTHRGYASSVAIVTGHEDPAKEVSSINWKNLSTATDTIVFLMGMENLAGIVENLKAHGRKPTTPVALVRWGTTVAQETLTGTLDTIVDLAAARHFGSPALIVVGEVVNLRPVLNWFEQKPLFGKRVVVTRSRAQASILSDALREYGAEAIEFPTIEIAPPPSFDGLDAAINRLGEYDWVIFTSVNGVEAFITRLRDLGRDIRALAGCKLAAIGSQTAAALEARGLRVEFVPSEYRAEAIISGLSDADLRGKRVLLPRAKEAREVLARDLTAQGAQVDDVTAYVTVTGGQAARAAELREMFAKGKIHVVTFTSSSTVRNFVKLMGVEDIAGLLQTVTVACIGPITADTARELGLHVDIMAGEYTINGLVEALAAHFAGGR
ncbi:MAG: uroporphyrinogen-III C-methyltransferase [Syntrophothermus sp.]